MSNVFGFLFEKIVSRDISIAKPAIEEVLALRSCEFDLNGYSELYFDYDGLIEDYNDIYSEDIS